MHPRVKRGSVEDFFGSGDQAYQEGIFWAKEKALSDLSS